MGNTISKLFGGGPRYSPVVQTAQKVVTQPADAARGELLKRLATLRRATMTSELTTPSIKRKTLGAA